MFQLLLESKADTRLPFGGSLVSTVAHAALVTGLVLLTAQRLTREAPAPEPRATFIPVEPPRVAPSQARPLQSPSAAAPAPLGAPPIPIVVDIPIGLPPVDLTVTPGSAADFLPRGVPGGRADGIPGAPASRGGAAAFTELEVDKPVVMAPGMAAPLYPASLRAAGLSGNVIVEFVVDTLGRVEDGSSRVVSADHPLFAASVRSALPTYRFLPAEAQGRRVRQLVRLPFRFSLNP
jgi:periplasmic protein TonB